MLKQTIQYRQPASPSFLCTNHQREHFCDFGKMRL